MSIPSATSIEALARRLITRALTTEKELLDALAKDGRLPWTIELNESEELAKLYQMDEIAWQTLYNQEQLYKSYDVPWKPYSQARKRLETLAAKPAVVAQAQADIAQKALAQELQYQATRAPARAFFGPQH